MCLERRECHGHGAQVRDGLPGEGVEQVLIGEPGRRPSAAAAGDGHDQVVDRSGLYEKAPESIRIGGIDRDRLDLVGQRSPGLGQALGVASGNGRPGATGDEEPCGCQADAGGAADHGDMSILEGRGAHSRSFPY